MVDESSELWVFENVDSVLEEGLRDTEVGGLEFLGMDGDQSGQSYQSQARKRLHPISRHLLLCSFEELPGGSAGSAV